MTPRTDHRAIDGAPALRRAAGVTDACPELGARHCDRGSCLFQGLEHGPKGLFGLVDGTQLHREGGRSARLELPKMRDLCGAIGGRSLSAEDARLRLGEANPPICVEDRAPYREYPRGNLKIDSVG